MVIVCHAVVAVVVVVVVVDNDKFFLRPSFPFPEY
jgi:hypothetical protein